MFDKRLLSTGHTKKKKKKNQLTGDEDKDMTAPDKNKLLMPKPCDYSKLGYDGFVKKNTYVSDGDIIIGKVMS